MPAMNATSRTRAPIAPTIAVGAIKRATATASSAIGSNVPTAPASDALTPKSLTARREAGRSSSLPTPATMNTPARMTLTASTAVPMA